MTHFRGIKRIHFVGIGGIGMSGIAEVLHNLNYDVSGSDCRESANTRRLNDLGIKIWIGHSPENVTDAHVVVISSAVNQDNPEVAEAHRQNIPVIPRAEMLAELMRLKSGIAVTGSHGKTTTTSLISTMLTSFDPTVVIGGKLKGLGSNAKLGQGDILVAEADESDGSFILLTPTVAVLTCIDREHMDYFKSMEDLKKAFLDFINKVPFYGLAILCKDDQHVRDLVPSVHRRFITYGITADADLVAKDITRGPGGSRFRAFLKGQILGEFKVPSPGIHNVSNALAAIAVGLELGMAPSWIAEGLASFSGIQRRFELKGEAAGVRVFDDYAHHPTEIRATLAAAKEISSKRVVALFQPHRYSRTRDLMTEFFGAFKDADLVYLTDIYPAGEEPEEGVHSSVLENGIRQYSQVDVVYSGDKKNLINHIVNDLKEDDIFFTLGAGDVFKMGEEILKSKGKEQKAKDEGVYENNRKLLV